MVNSTAFGEENNQSALNEAEDLSAEIQSYEPPEGELHLRLYLPSKRELAIPATGIREVVSQSPSLITPIPNASVLLLGTMNLRGQVVWVADLGQFLGEPGTLTTERSEIPVITIEGEEMIMGLAVEQIAGMEWLEPEALEMASNLSDEIAPFILGEWEEEGSALLLLDPSAILRSARWAA
ncbi:CheW domain-containing protein [Dactylococcopsis salina]|uniref:Chemotaxis signal transduction protein n=1 Tax=Dactylococcopsis salina (strain PCC 8305) TaxID=13035 RepID=K9YYE5_DACS8|nr:CheW domain-containing protein [Dactylococcopsis salina]AFZ51971.1 chemotaxis signal transduction protein [Dactylococcopsis salina PCC 8305]